MDLTKVNGTYSKELLENLGKIRQISFSKYRSTEDMRDYILEVVEPATIDAVAKNRFIEYVYNCKDKKALYWLVHNTIHKAMTFKPAKRGC